MDAGGKNHQVEFMNICRISMIAKRGSSPDLIIEVEGVKVTVPLLSKDQRYKLGSLIYGGLSYVDLPCELKIKNGTGDEPLRL